MPSSIFSVAVLGAALAAAPDGSPRALFEQAQARQKAGDLAAAERLYRRVIAADPKSAEAFANLGVVLAGQERYAQAIVQYRKALALKPSLSALRLNLGLARLKSGEPASAVPEFEAFLQQDPGNGRARQLLATALLESDQYQEAAVEFEKLLPQGAAPVKLGLATSYTRLGRREEASRLFASVLKDDKSAAVQLTVAQAYLAANDFDSARAALDRALELDPRLPGAHFTLGSVFWKQQDTAQAIEQWKQELARDPASFESNFSLGAVLVEKGRFDEAESYLNQARKLRPAHGPSLYYLGRVYWKTNRPAARLLEESVQLDPGNRAARYLLAQIYKSQGQMDAANRELAAVKSLGLKQVDEDVDILEKARR